MAHPNSDIKYRCLFKTIHIGILLLDIKNRVITDANPFIAELSGYGLKEIIGKKISEVGFFNNILTGKNIFKQLKTHSEVVFENIPFFTKDGSSKIVEFSAHTYMNDDTTNQDTMVQCTIRDLTEQHTTQRELYEITQRLEALMNAIPAGIAYSLDPKCEYIKTNPYLAKMMDVTLADNISASTKDRTTVGKHLKHYMNGRELKAKDLPMQRAIAEHKVIGPFEIEVELLNGKRWVHEAYGAPVHDKQGNVVGGVSINMDLTERKKAEQTEKLTLIVEKEKEKLTFIADAAHELRTPLAIIRGNVDLALSKRSDPQNALIAINEEVIHLTGLLSDLSLLTTKEIDFRRKLDSHKKVAISKLIEEIAGRHRSYAQKKYISIIIEDLPQAQVIGDDFYLERLFTNIITNAVAYGKESGHIWIRGKKDAKNLKIIIRDDGIGIAQKDLEHIFDRFFRAEASRSKDFGGSGLGLSIVKWIVEAHGGTITVVSELNKGSTFTITLPLPHQKKMALKSATKTV